MLLINYELYTIPYEENKTFYIITRYVIENYPVTLCNWYLKTSVLNMYLTDTFIEVHAGKNTRKYGFIGFL